MLTSPGGVWHTIPQEEGFPCGRRHRRGPALADPIRTLTDFALGGRVKLGSRLSLEEVGGLWYALPDVGALGHGMGVSNPSGGNENMQHAPILV